MVINLFLLVLVFAAVLCLSWILIPCMPPFNRLVAKYVTGRYYSESKKDLDRNGNVITKVTTYEFIEYVPGAGVKTRTTGENNYTALRNFNFVATDFVLNPFKFKKIRK